MKVGPERQGERGAWRGAAATKKRAKFRDPQSLAVPPAPLVSLGIAAVTDEGRGFEGEWGEFTKKND